EAAAKTDWQAAWKLLTHGPGRVRWGTRPEPEAPPMPVRVVEAPAEVTQATGARPGEVDTIRSLLFSDAGRDLLDRATQLVEGRTQRHGGASVRGAIPETTPRASDRQT